ncbi:acyl-CoA dehydrogenase family protein [Croceicoccus estronivorus]|uniref:acyl-CoA dehydrogenase family protein n=1 Tax=Croceicoccus estronivorus TaxID=1172626 RepID=UPI000AEB2759|nr:acyl-CoA dehydrogenase family protein [Croceicoccus estronivorus]
MDLSLTGEQEALQHSVRSLCEDHFTTAMVRACEDDAAQAAAIYDLLFAMGIGGIAIDEAAGGLSLGLTELVVAQSELGRALVPMLFTESTVMAARILANSGNDAAKALLASLAAGQTFASCAWQEDGRPALDAPQAVAASGQASSLVLNGTKTFVPEASRADILLVHASDPTGVLLLCIVERDARGISFTELPNMADLSMASVTFDNTPVMITAASGQEAIGAWEAGLTAMKIAIAAQAVGGAQRILEMTRDYACTRHQFGQPIGSFQSIAHYLADAAVNVEGARMLTYRAAAAADDGDPAATWADLAKMKATQVYRDVSALGIQVHGGIGFTLEADPQLFYRRAKHLQLMYGEPLDLQERAGAALIAGTHKVLEA